MRRCASWKDEVAHIPARLGESDRFLEGGLARVGVAVPVENSYQNRQVSLRIRSAEYWNNTGVMGLQPLGKGRAETGWVRFRPVCKTWCAGARVSPVRSTSDGSTPSQVSYAP